MRRSIRLVIALLIGALCPATVHAQATAAREVEPVIVKGAKLGSWSVPAADIVCKPYPSGATSPFPTSLTGGRDAHNGTFISPPATGIPVNEIAAYRWDGTQFVEIPVQVDEMYPYCLSNPNSSFAIYSGTDKELTYAYDVEAWKKVDGLCTSSYVPGDFPIPDPVAGLDDDDEVVFMASDAGSQAPLGAPYPVGTIDKQAIAVVDPLNAANVKFVYLVRKSGGSSFNVTNGYVSYVRDADADQWIDRFSFQPTDPEKLGTSNTGYGPNLHGTVCDPDGTVRQSTDRFVPDGVTVSTAAYEWHASGRWMVREMHVAKPGQPGVYGPDLIDRWKGRAFQQSPDSNISLVGFEDEQVNWEANSALLGERMGPVRAIRETWGADSGTNVTKTESFYRDEITYHYHVRVHPIPPDGLYTSWDYNPGVAAKYYDILKPDGVDIDGINDDQGNVDGADGQSFFFDVPDPTFNLPSAVLNWEEVSGRDDFGSLVYIVEIKGATTVVHPAVVPYYRDDSCLDDGTGDAPVSRPWPGEASSDQRVMDGYCAENGKPAGCHVCRLSSDPGPCDVDCKLGQTQGAYGAHGIHYFFTTDSDNLASPEVLTEIDAQQWQFAVPTEHPTNVGDAHGNVVKTPLQTTAIQIGLLPNAPPAAGDQSVNTDEDAPVDIVLSGLDLDTCDLTFSIVTPPANGSLSPITDHACMLGTPNSDTATVTCAPATGFSGSDSFTYIVNDGSNDSNVATVSINVRSLTTPTPTATATPTPTQTPTATVTTTPGPGATATVTSTLTATPTVEPTPPPGCGATICGSVPISGCRKQVEPQKGSLVMKNKTPDDRDRLVWKFAKGDVTPKADFGDPLTTTDYEICVYDGNDDLVTRACAPAADVCDGAQPCWKETAHGFKYRNDDVGGGGGRTNGLSIALKEGLAAGKTTINVSGKGLTPALPSLPIAQPVTVQLVNGGNVCWEATYSAPAAHDDAAGFKDKGD